VVAEAMAMGCPVVVTPEVGLAHLVEESGAGVVTSNEPRQLARIVTNLLADSPLRQELGCQGREAARSHLSWDSIGGPMHELYARVMHRGSPGGVGVAGPEPGRI